MLRGEVHLQLYSLCVMFLAGVIPGVLFDFLRAYRLAFRRRRRQRSRTDLGGCIEDLFFWAFAGGVMLAALFYATDGELRFFAFLGASLGLWLYFLLASPVVVFLFGEFWLGLAKAYDVCYGRPRARLSRAGKAAAAKGRQLARQARGWSSAKVRGFGRVLPGGIVPSRLRNALRKISAP